MRKRRGRKLAILCTLIALLVMVLPMGSGCASDGKPAPKAAFTAEPTSGSCPLEVQFTDRSRGEVTGWVWDFGDGSTSTTQSPSHTYTSPGKYTVSLKVIGPGGSDTETKSDYIEVTDSPPEAGFSAEPTSGTAPLAVDFADQSGGNITDWEWDFDSDGTVDSTQQNPSHTYDMPGTYTVSLTVTGPGGSDTETKTDHIEVTIGPPEARFTAEPTTGIAPLDVQFTDQSRGEITHRQWDFGDGQTSTEQNPSHTYDTPEKYTVSLKVTGPGGSDTETKGDYIESDHTEGEYFEREGMPDFGQHTAGWCWVGAAANGLYWLSRNGYPDLVPAEYMEIVEGGYPRLLQEICDSTWYDADGDGVWDVDEAGYEFGQGIAPYGYLHALRHFISRHGYEDELVVGLKSDVTFSEATFQDYKEKLEQGVVILSVSAYPWEGSSHLVTGVSYNEYTGEIKVSEPHLSGLHNNDPASREYDTWEVTSEAPFKVGTVFGEKSISHITYICLSALCPYPAPEAEFWADPLYGVVPLTVQFTNQSRGYVDEWAWNFDNDGTVDSTERSPVHTYDTLGTYTVSLTVTGLGGSDTFTYHGFIQVLPIAAAFTADPTSGDAPLTVEFTDQSTGEITEWAWDFDNDGTVDSTEQGPSHTYDIPGGYNVSLTVTGPAGSHTTYQYIQVFPLAAFWASPTFGAPPLTVEFTEFSMGEITEWAWDFDGDGTVDSTEQSPSHTYDAEGTYTVSLTVTGPAGSHTCTYDDYIELLPIAANFTASPTSGDAPLTVQFTDQSRGEITEWAWDFDNDGTVDSTEQSPSHTYDTPGGYSVSLTVTGPGGLHTTYGYIQVFPLAQFWADPTSGYAPLTVQFTDQSMGEITEWAWDFGDGGTSTEPNPSHTYDTAGTYTVSLTVTGPGGSDTFTYHSCIQVSAFSANFAVWPTSGYAPLEVQFTDWSSGEITEWAWDFDNDGTVDSTEQNPSHTYGTPGTYTVSLTVTGPGGSDTTTKSDYIEVAPILADFSGLPTFGIAPLEVQFTDCSEGQITEWAWDFGDGGTSTEENPTHTYDTPGIYGVSLTVTGPYGSDTRTYSDYILVFPLADFAADPTFGAAPLEVQFTDQSTGEITSWAWDFGDGGTSTGEDPTHTYDTPGTYTVALTVTGSGGSHTETKQDYVEVVPVLAYFTASPYSGPAPLEVQFTDWSSGEITEWAWDFGDEETSAEQNPSHTYDTAGTYTVSLTVTGPGGSDTWTRDVYVGVITIGYLTDWTGPASPALVPAYYALDDLVTYMNEEGLIPGGELKLVTYDTKSDPARFVPGYEWLKGSGAQVIFTSIPGVGETLKSFAGADKVPIVSTATALAQLEPPGWVFCASSPVSYQAKTLLKWISESHWDYGQGIPKIGSVGWNTPYQIEVHNGLQDYCQDNPGKFEYMGAYLAPMGTSIWAAEIAALKGCDYVFVPSNGIAAATFMRESRMRGYTGTFIGMDALAAYLDPLLYVCGWDYLDGTLTAHGTLWWNESVPMVDLAEELLDRYRPDEAVELIQSGLGYVGGVQQAYFFLDILRTAIEAVGGGSFDGQAFYDTATSYDAYATTGAMWGGSLEWAFTETKRYLADHVVIYEWSAAAQDLVRITDWLSVVIE